MKLNAPYRHDVLSCCERETEHDSLLFEIWVNVDRIALVISHKKVLHSSQRLSFLHNWTELESQAEMCNNDDDPIWRSNKGKSFQMFTMCCRRERKGKERKERFLKFSSSSFLEVLRVQSAGGEHHHHVGADHEVGRSGCLRTTRSLFATISWILFIRKPRYFSGTSFFPVACKKGTSASNSSKMQQHEVEMKMKKKTKKMKNKVPSNTHPSRSRRGGHHTTPAGWRSCCPGSHVRI